jgi:hypothetical protein
MFYKIPGPKKSGEVIIEQPISVVWDFVTDSNNFNAIIQGEWYWGPFDRSNARPGMSFRKGSPPAGTQWDYFIVNWEPPRRFSMGDSPKSWVFDFYLIDMGTKTKVRFTRRFNVLGWLPSSRGLIDYTLEALERECRQSAQKR